MTDAIGRAVYVGLSQVFASACALCAAPLVARQLGQVGRGEVASLSAVILIAPVALSMGLPAEVRRLAATGTSERALVQAWLRPSLVAAPTGLLVALLLAYSLLSSLRLGLLFLLGVILTAAPLAVWRNSYVSLLVARNDYWGIALFNGLPAALVSIATVLTSLTGRLSSSTVIVYGACGIVLGLLVGKGRTRPLLEDGHNPPAHLLRRSCAGAPGQIADVASTRLDQLFLLPLVGAAGLGVYAVAATVVQLVLPLSHSLASRSFREVANRKLTVEDRSALQGFYLRTAALTAAVCCVALAVTLPWAIPLTFGENFRSAVGPALILLPGCVAYTMTYVACSHLVAVGRAGTASGCQTFGLLCGLALLFPFASVWGIDGAALASTLGYAAACVPAVRSLGLGRRDLRPRGTDLGASFAVLLK